MNAHLNSEAGSISTTDLLVLTDWESAESLHETIFFQFQNNLVLTSKDEEVSTDTSPFIIEVRVPCLVYQANLALCWTFSVSLSVKFSLPSPTLLSTSSLVWIIGHISSSAVPEEPIGGMT